MSRNTAPRYSARNPARARLPELPPSTVFSLCLRQITGNGFRGKAALFLPAQGIAPWQLVGVRQADRRAFPLAQKADFPARSSFDLGGHAVFSSMSASPLFSGLDRA